MDCSTSTGDATGGENNDSKDPILASEDKKSSPKVGVQNTREGYVPILRNYDQRAELETNGNRSVKDDSETGGSTFNYETERKEEHELQDELLPLDLVLKHVEETRQCEETESNPLAREKSTNYQSSKSYKKKFSLKKATIVVLSYLFVFKVYYCIAI